MDEAQSIDGDVDGIETSNSDTSTKRTAEEIMEQFYKKAAPALKYNFKIYKVVGPLSDELIDIITKIDPQILFEKNKSKFYSFYFPNGEVYRV